MERHRVLLLGLGFWGTRWMRVISDIDRCILAGISGAEEDIARLRREYDLSGVGTFTDYREAIDDVDADILIIAIPTKFHTDAAKRGMARGMNLLSEKPLAWDITEARDILEYRKKYPKLKYMADQNYRWRTHNQTMRKAIQDGMIGKVGSVHIEFRQPEDLLGYREFLDMPLLQDVSIHHFDLTRFFTGADCESTYAQSYRPAWSRFEGLPATEAVLRMQGGIVVNYNTTWAARGKPTGWDGNFTITGDQGCLTLDAEGNIRFFAVGGSGCVLVEPVKMERTELDYALHMLTRCINDDTTPESSIEENYNSFATVCAAEESVKADRPVDVQQL